MKRIALSLAIVASLATGAAVADGTGAVTSIDFDTLTVDQLDALTGIIGGLPGQ